MFFAKHIDIARKFPKISKFSKNFKIIISQNIFFLNIQNFKKKLKNFKKIQNFHKISKLSSDFKIFRGRNCLTFVRTWVHPRFLVGTLLLIFFVFCVVMCVCCCFVCLHHVSSVASVSGLFILVCPFGFL